MKNACLILDNARIHRWTDIERIAAIVGFKYKFLCLYSYMLNPIENVFSKIKNGVRSRWCVNESKNSVDFILKETRRITAEDYGGFLGF